MRVITQKSLLENIFTELQKIELNKGSCHYGDYEQWCVRGEDVEQAIKNLFLEDGIFKPTKDLIHCNECKFNRGIGCPFHEEVKHIKNDFCSYAEREE